MDRKHCKRCGLPSCLCRSRIGNNLHARIPSIFKGAKDCNCDKDKKALNKLSPEEARSQLGNWVSLLVEKASRLHIPEIISRAVAQKWLTDSIDEAEECIRKYREHQDGQVTAMRDMRSNPGMHMPPQGSSVPRPPQ